MGFVVSVARETFVVETGEQLEQFRADILAAVRAGGALVAVGPTTEMLVTPATAVRIDTVGALQPAQDFPDFDRVYD